MGDASPSHLDELEAVSGAARVVEERSDWSEDNILGFIGLSLPRVYRANRTEQPMKPGDAAGSSRKSDRPQRVETDG